MGGKDRPLALVEIYIIITIYISFIVWNLQNEITFDSLAYLLISPYNGDEIYIHRTKL